MRRAIAEGTRTFAAFGSTAAIIVAALALGGCSPSHPQQAGSHPPVASSRPTPARSGQASAASAAGAFDGQRQQPDRHDLRAGGSGHHGQ